MIGRRLSHFRILDRIGEGGMGIFRVDLKDGSVSSLDVQTDSFSFFFVSPDGRHLAYEYRTGDANVWLLESFR
jgi:hypothetical protein